MPQDSKDYLHTIICGIVEHPSEVQIDKTQDEMGVLLSLSVAASDMGKVIGREGQTAKAVRHIINAHGFMQKAKVSMKILEPIPA